MYICIGGGVVVVILIVAVVCCCKKRNGGKSRVHRVVYSDKTALKKDYVYSSLLTNTPVHLRVASLVLSLPQRLLQSLQRQLHLLLVVAGEDPSVPAVLVAVVLGALRLNPCNNTHRRNDHVPMLVDELVQLLLALVRVLV